MDQKEKEVTSEDKNNQTYCSSMIIKQKRILKKHNALLSKPNKNTSLAFTCIFQPRTREAPQRIAAAVIFSSSEPLTAIS